MDIGDNKILEGMGGKLPSGKLPSGKLPVGYLILGLAALVSLGVILWFIFKEDYPTCTGFDCSTDDNSLSTSPGDIECPADPCTTIDCCTVVPTGGGSARDSDSDRDSDSNSGSDRDSDRDSDSSLICSTPSSEDKVPYIVTETSLENAFTDSTVTAVCASGYVGTAVVAPCTELDGPYQLSGCDPLNCTRPYSAYLYYFDEDYDEDDLTLPFTTSLVQNLRCKSDVGTTDNPRPVYPALGYEGGPIVESCAEQDQPYQLRGCSELRCTSPSQDIKEPYNINGTDIYAVPGGHKWIPGRLMWADQDGRGGEWVDSVYVEGCSAGYKLDTDEFTRPPPSGAPPETHRSPLMEKCTTMGGPYRLSGCILE